MAASPNKLTGTWADQVKEVENLILSRIGAEYGKATAETYAKEWVTYANENKGKGTVGQLYLAWFLNQSNLPENLGNDIILGTSTAAGTAAAIPQNLQSISPTQLASGIWGTLTSKNLWIRLGEGVVALILLDVGLKAFTNKSVIETVAKKTPAKAVLF